MANEHCLLSALPPKKASQLRVAYSPPVKRNDPLTTLISNGSGKLKTYKSVDTDAEWFAFLNKVR